MARTNCLGSRLVWNRRGRSRSICLEWQLIRLEWNSACHAWCWHKKRLKKCEGYAHLLSFSSFFYFFLALRREACVSFVNKSSYFQTRISLQGRSKKSHQINFTSLDVNSDFFLSKSHQKNKGYTMIDFNMQMTQPSLSRWHCFSQSSLYICTLREVPWQQSWKAVEDHRFRIPPLLMHWRTNYEPWH